MDLLKQKQWFDSPEFEAKFHCDAPLGSFCAPTGTVFRLWAPTAETVTLNLYDNGTDGKPTQTVTMTAGEKGLWTYESDKNLDGTYYDYDVTVDDTCRKTGDPYAKAAGVNGHRSMVIDLRRTDPEGWDKDKAPAHTPENVIYELHVKDFSWDTAGGFDAADRGRFTALCRTGTTLNKDGVHPTGLDYLKQLGVTHIQLLPVYDYGSVDEADSTNQYNWGYDPVNYNVPEGSYSSDPFRGEVRIKELKQAIQALHANGFRVIMDVVYNHTYSLDVPLFKAAPWYYYRQKPDGTPSNGSGCGNDVASERSMCAQYILDSILYWTEEYHMDGYRFDLMGLLDVDLMTRIQNELDKRYGVGEKLVYGEPWSADTSATRPDTMLCNKPHMKDVHPAVGSFCDDTRDAVKGNLMNPGTVGFVNGGPIFADKVRPCIRGWVRSEGGPAQTPMQTVTYLSCHDDWTLWDKLVYTMDPEKRFTSSQPEILRANRMAAAMNFCCQGHVFFLSGEEYARTKGGVKNSYCSSAEINLLDWNRAWENKDLVDYYRGLIGLRMQLPCLQDKTARAAQHLLTCVDLAPNFVGVSLANDTAVSLWDKIILLFNADHEEHTLHLPADETWQTLADADSSLLWKTPAALTDNEAVVAPVSAMILGRVTK